MIVRWVLIAVAVLWPVFSFAGGLAFSPLVALAALLCLPAGLRGWTPRVYMFFLFAALEFAVASARWAQQDVAVLGVDAGSGAPRINIDALRVGFNLLWCGLLMQAAKQLTPGHARTVLWAVAAAIAVQLVIVVLLTVFETQALDLFMPIMSEASEGVQNISRNQIILSIGAPVLALLVIRVLPDRGGMAAGIGVLAIAGATMVARGVDGAWLALATGCVAGGVILLAPRWGFRILGIGTALLIALAPILFRIATQDADASLATSSAEYRLAIWKRVINVIEQNPLFGAGVGALRQITETIPSGVFAGEKLVPNHPHNMLLQLWAETGAIGAGFLACAVLAAGIRMPEPRKLGAVAPSSAALIAQAMVISMVSFDLWNDWWWAVLGLVAVFLVVVRRADGEAPQPVLASWSRIPVQPPSAGKS